MTIQLQQDVYEAIGFFNSSGRVDMFDRKRVAHLCREIGYPEAAQWIEENACDYLRGVLGGFTPVTQTK